MTIEALLRDAIRTGRPFRITMADGRTVEVPQTEFACLSPSGRILYVAEENDRLERLDVHLITSVQREKQKAES